MNNDEKAIFDHLLTMTEAMAGLKARLDNHDTRAASLAQRCETRITALEQRLAALEEPAHPDDVRDALRALDAMHNGATAGTVWDDEMPGTPGTKSDLHVPIRTMGAKAQAELIDKLGLVVDDAMRDLDDALRNQVDLTGSEPLRKLDNFPPIDEDGEDASTSGECWWTQQKDGYTWMSDCGHQQRFSVEWFEERMRRCPFCGKPTMGLVTPVSVATEDGE